MLAGALPSIVTSARPNELPATVRLDACAVGRHYASVAALEPGERGRWHRVHADRLLSL